MPDELLFYHLQGEEDAQQAAAEHEAAASNEKPEERPEF